MIILLDQEKKCLQVYNSTGKKIILFESVNQLRQCQIDEEPIYYVTKAAETDIQQVIDLVSSITGIPSTPIYTSNQTYLHSVKRGPLVIPDPSAPPEKPSELLKFYDYYDIKPLDDILKNLISNNPIVQRTITNGQIEIIDDIRKNKIMEEKKIELEKKKIKQKKVDEKMDKLLSDKPAAELADSMFDSDTDGVETMEITEGSLNKPTETEVLMKQLGIKN